MHDNSMRLMHGLITRPCFNGVRSVLDCGSAVVDPNHGCYRPMCREQGWTYTGFDANEGTNVDVTGDIYSLSGQFDNEFDLVITGQMIEHLDFPLLAVQEMKRAVKTGGWIIIIAPFVIVEHRFPIDCWRYLPDGMRFLLEGFTDFESALYNEIDCYAVAKKPEGYQDPWAISRRTSINGGAMSKMVL